MFGHCYLPSCPCSVTIIFHPAHVITVTSVTSRWQLCYLICSPRQTTIQMTALTRKTNIQITDLFSKLLSSTDNHPNYSLVPYAAYQHTQISSWQLCYFAAYQHTQTFSWQLCYFSCLPTHTNIQLSALLLQLRTNTDTIQLTALLHTSAAFQHKQLNRWQLLTESCLLRHTTIQMTAFLVKLLTNTDKHPDDSFVI